MYLSHQNKTKRFCCCQLAFFWHSNRRVERRILQLSLSRASQLANATQTSLATRKLFPFQRLSSSRTKSPFVTDDRALHSRSQVLPINSSFMANAWRSSCWSDVLLVVLVDVVDNKRRTKSIPINLHFHPKSSWLASSFVLRPSWKLHLSAQIASLTRSPHRTVTFYGHVWMRAMRLVISAILVINIQFLKMLFPSFSPKSQDGDPSEWVRE